MFDNRTYNTTYKSTNKTCTKDCAQAPVPTPSFLPSPLRAKIVDSAIFRPTPLHTPSTFVTLCHANFSPGLYTPLPDVPASLHMSQLPSAFFLCRVDVAMLPPFIAHYNSFCDLRMLTPSAEDICVALHALCVVLLIPRFLYS